MAAARSYLGRALLLLIAILGAVVIIAALRGNHVLLHQVWAGLGGFWTPWWRWWRWGCCWWR